MATCAFGGGLRFLNLAASPCSSAFGAADGVAMPRPRSRRPRQPLCRWRLGAAPLAVAALADVASGGPLTSIETSAEFLRVVAQEGAMQATSSVYSYPSIVDHYCNVEMDWGPLPPRPEGASELLQVQAFVRHGARIQGGTQWCWPGDELGEWSCNLEKPTAELARRDRDEKGVPTCSIVEEDHMVDQQSQCWGQLTETGYEQERNNGQRLREAYILREQLLPEELMDHLHGIPLSAMLDDDSQGRLEDDGDLAEAQKKESEGVFDWQVVVRSTDMPRTRQSARAVLAGLYEELNTEGWPYKEEHMEMVKSREFAQDNLYVNSKMCPAAKWSVPWHFDHLSPDRDENLRNLCQRLNPCGMSNKDCAWWLTHLVDCLMSRMCPTVPFHPPASGSVIPEYFLDNDAELLRRVWRTLDEIAVDYFHSMVEVGVFSSLVSEVLDSAERAVSVADDGAGASGSRASIVSKAPKFMLYSGHDTGPMEPLSVAFNLSREAPFWPAFASMTVLEVWATPEGGKMVRWIANGKVAAGPIPFDQFRKQASSIVAMGAHCEDPEPPREPVMQPAVPPSRLMPAALVAVPGLTELAEVAMPASLVLGAVAVLAFAARVATARRSSSGESRWRWRVTPRKQASTIELNERRPSELRVQETA